MSISHESLVKNIARDQITLYCRMITCLQDGDNVNFHIRIQINLTTTSRLVVTCWVIVFKVLALLWNYLWMQRLNSLLDYLRLFPTCKSVLKRDFTGPLRCCEITAVKEESLLSASVRVTVRNFNGVRKKIIFFTSKVPELGKLTREIISNRFFCKSIKTILNKLFI